MSDAIQASPQPAPARVGEESALRTPEKAHLAPDHSLHFPSTVHSLFQMGICALALAESKTHYCTCQGLSQCVPRELSLPQALPLPLLQPGQALLAILAGAVLASHCDLSK